MYSDDGPVLNQMQGTTPPEPASAHSSIRFLPNLLPQGMAPLELSFKLTEEREELISHFCHVFFLMMIKDLFILL